jgi:hypothetical protein
LKMTVCIDVYHRAVAHFDIHCRQFSYFFEWRPGLIVTPTSAYERRLPLPNGA